MSLTTGRSSLFHLSPQKKKSFDRLLIDDDHEEDLQEPLIGPSRNSIVVLNSASSSIMMRDQLSAPQDDPSIESAMLESFNENSLPNTNSESEVSDVSDVTPPAAAKKKEVVLEEAMTENTKIPRNLGWKQVFALFSKNLLTKYRTPLPTLMEIFTPVFMMLILVFAYTLSEVTDKDARLYSTIQVDAPGPWLDLAVRATEFVDLGAGDVASIVTETSRRRQLSEPSSWPIFQDMAYLDRPVDDEDEAADFATGRRLQAFEEDDDDNFNATTQDGDIFALLSDAQRQVRFFSFSLSRFLGRAVTLLTHDLFLTQIRRLLKNPLPAPTFTQYVSTSSVLSSFIDADALPTVLSDSSYGRQWGNLLTLGTLHLSPSNSVAEEFWAYLNDTYPALLLNETVKVQVHENEDKALEFINDNLQERTWALLDFSSYVNEEDFSYKIRMNYTTLPNTHEIVNWVSIGLDREYQKYYLSGYLTLQRTLNEFAFSRLQNNGCDVDTGNIWSMPMPTAAYSQVR